MVGSRWSDGWLRCWDIIISNTLSRIDFYIWFVLKYRACTGTHNIIGSRGKCVFMKHIPSSLLLLLILDLDKPVVNVSSSSPTEGETVRFTCNVKTNDIIYGYGWNYNGIQISGARSKEYSIINGNRSNSGYYSCNVTTQNFNKTSQEIILTYICKCTFLFVIIIFINDFA